jgi:hypothetical protein
MSCSGSAVLTTDVSGLLFGAVHGEGTNSPTHNLFKLTWHVLQADWRVRPVCSAGAYI